jgi:hypothetical protein
MELLVAVVVVAVAIETLRRLQTPRAEARIPVRIQRARRRR